MLKQELAKVRKNRLLMVTLAVVMLIPSIYSTIFLKSMWDTYERMDNFPVAVINNDKAASKAGKEINIGEELTKTLDESSDMDFQMMSADKAREGLNEGKYFMAITIPEDFSADSLTLMDKDPKQMNLTYETSAGHNFTASKFSEIAAGRLKNEVQSNVTRTYAQTVLSQFKKAGLGLEQAGDGAKTLANGLTQLADGSNKLEDGATKLNNGLGEFGPGLTTYTNGVGTAANGTQKLADGGSQLQSGINQYTAGVNQAADNVPALAQGINQYTAGVEKLQGGVGQYTAGVEKLQGGVGQYTAGVEKLQDGVGQYTAGVAQLQDGVGQYTAGVEKAQSGSKKVADGSKKLADGLADLNLAVNTKDVKTLTDGMADYKRNVGMLKQMSSGASPEQIQIMTSMESMSDQIKVLGGLAQSKDLSDADRATLGKSVGELATNLKALETSLKAQIEAASKLGALADGYDKLYAGMSGYVASTQGAIGQLAPGAKELASGATDLNGGLSQLTGKNAELNGGLSQLTGKNAELNGGLSQLTGKNAELNGGLSQLTGKNAELNGGLSQLTDKNGQLNDGTNKLAGGLAKLQSKSGDLQNGATQAVGGINQLNAGLSQLNANTGRLQSAVAQLNDGSGQLANGAGQLNVGLVKANDGADELGTKLTEGGEQVKQVRDDKANLDMFATPIKETHEDRTTVKNNGTGMAPYMIAIYVFVGMITLMAAMNLTEPASYPKSSFTWWLSKYTIPFVIVFLGAIITTIVSISIIGLTPVNTPAFLISLVVIAIMDMSIVYFFTAAFGKIGTFISLILLVLQLSGSGGTYPIQLSSGFFQWLHPFLPMTYAIDALRGSLSTGLSVTGPVTVMFLIFVTFSLLSWVYFAIQKSKRYRFDDSMNTDTLENK